MIRVSKQKPCPACEGADWCSFFDDLTAVICMRTPSAKQTKNGGYIHRLVDDWTPPPRRIVRRKATTSKPDCNAIHQRCVDTMRPESLGWLSNDLGISVDSIKRFDVGYHDDKNVYSMPMRRPDGSICGIKYRPRNGNKFCETGSKSGMFFVPGTLTRDSVLVVEGCSDAMAIHDIGFQSVIGRDNCTGNVSHIVTLFRRLQPREIVIVPDNDQNGRGQRGAETLSQLLRLHHPVELLELPGGINDVRDCIQQNESADWLRNRIDGLVSIDTSERNQ